MRLFFDLFKILLFFTVLYCRILPRIKLYNPLKVREHELLLLLYYILYSKLQSLKNIYIYIIVLFIQVTKIYKVQNILVEMIYLP